MLFCYTLDIPWKGVSFHRFPIVGHGGWQQAYLAARWCNGSTTDFGSVCRGSSPRRATRLILSGMATHKENREAFYRQRTYQTRGDDLSISAASACACRAHTIPGR